MVNRYFDARISDLQEIVSLSGHCNFVVAMPVLTREFFKSNFRQWWTEVLDEVRKLDAHVLGRQALLMDIEMLGLLASLPCFRVW